MSQIYGNGLSPLVAFLLDRFTEDEAEARGQANAGDTDNRWSTEHVEHVLADLAAKRRIVELTQSGSRHQTVRQDAYYHVVRILASAYDQHRDWQEPWRQQ